VSEHPSSWIEVTLGDLLHFNYGKSLPDRARSGAGFPVYGSNGVVGYHNSALTDRETLIIGRKGSVGEVHFSPGACFPIDTTYYVEQFHGMPTRYWFYQLKNLRLSELNKATAIPGLSREDAYRTKVYLTPLNEQKRIADKLDTLLPRVDACRDRMERVPRILKRFRQSVLAAATSGQLTEDWRASTGLSSIQTVLLSEVLSEIKTGPFGTALHKSDYVGGEIPVVNPMHINDGKITHSFEMAVSPKKAEELSDFMLRAGDVVIARRGVMGRCAVVQPEQEGWLCGTGSIILRVQSQILPNYLQLFLSSPATVEALEAAAVGSTMVNLNQRILLSLQLSLPTLQEQREIIRRAENLFVHGERIETRYQNALMRVDRLTPVLLDKAFRGDLVPQDLNDEPASVLLDRIHSERVAQPDKPKRVVTRSKSTMNKMSNQSVKQAIHQLPKNTFSFDELHGEISKKLTGAYDLLKDILFALLDETEPSIMQTFDQEIKAMRFIRRHK
jgi:type I restriction enzyme S subunit